MNYSSYEFTSISKDFLHFTFTSVGPRGAITKAVQYTPRHSNIYNLAFGDYLPDGRIDDKVKNDNKDRDKILATVAMTIYKFSNQYPDKFVFFTGSTSSRTRLYRMALTLNLTELNKNFLIFGISPGKKPSKIEKFAKGQEYSDFLVKRKDNSFTI